MRVKVGDLWFTCEDQPIAVEFTDKEREQIANMQPADPEVGYRRYAHAVIEGEGAYMTREEFAKWIKE